MSENQPETPISEPSIAPTATPEPTEPSPIPPSTSEEVVVPPVVPESPTEAESAVPVNSDNEQINPVESENLAPKQTAQIDNSSENEASTPASKPETAQMGRNEPFDLAHDKPLGREVLVKAREVIQNKKRKKLDSILTLFTKQTKITNDEVEKLLHVSDATATRYLSILEQGGKIKQEGRTGRNVSYSKI